MLFAAVAMLFAGGCSSATITNTWKAPGLTGPIHFDKIVALVIYQDGTIRRAAEDAIVENIGPDRAVAAYNIVTEEDRRDVQKLKAKLQSAGVDGAVTMKLIDKKNETTYVPGSPGYSSFYGYYGYGGYVGTPGYFVTDTIATVETRIYSVKEDKLLWSATTETYNPSNVRDNVRDIAKAIGAELRKEKLIEEKPAK
jgi:hypothetical protein